MSMDDGTMTVDGEIFEVLARQGVPGQYDYRWISGPDPALSFTTKTSDGSSLSAEVHELNIRNFLEFRDDHGLALG